MKRHYYYKIDLLEKDNYFKGDEKEWILEMFSSYPYEDKDNAIKGIKESQENFKEEDCDVDLKLVKVTVEIYTNII